MSGKPSVDKNAPAIAPVKHQIIVEGGISQYEIHLPAMSEFLDHMEELGYEDVPDMINELEALADYALDGVPSDASAGAIKRPLKLMREVIFLFQWMVTKKK